MFTICTSYHPLSHCHLNGSYVHQLAGRIDNHERLQSTLLPISIIAMNDSIDSLLP